MLSYLVLLALALTSGYFIYIEIQNYIATGSGEDTDVKLLKTGALVTELYEAESLSKLALNSTSDNNFLSYAQKIDSIKTSIDSLKLLTQAAQQKELLDSLQILLGQKVANNNELRQLKKRRVNNNSLDKALKEFDKIKESFGRFSAENMVANYDKLSPNEQKVLTEYAKLLSQNVPKNQDGTADAEYADSILSASRVMLERAKLKDFKSQQSFAQKELEVNRNDLELSRQLQNIIAAFEQEILANTYEVGQKRQATMRRSIRLAGITALLGFIIVGIFTFLINRDFWKVQLYRQKLEKEKKFSESLLKSREQLISTVSHDLRTPLNTISGYTELMENTGITDKQARYLKNVKSASEYVGNLVNDLLDFSKLEAGKLNIEKVPFVAANLIQETAENVEALYRNKSIKLTLEIDEQLEKPLLGDPFRIRQILTNLLGNAFKFTEEGTITIKATAQNRSSKNALLQVDVIDTGIGIPNEKQHLIFKEFTQADHSTEKKFGGYGLGLTISKKLAELLKGSLQLRSKEGVGSTFTLQVPLEVTNKGVTVRKDTAYLVPKLKMLVIDDDGALLGMLRELAESMGITAHTFSNFLAIKQDSHLAYDLVLTDIQMPQVTGFEVLKKLKSGEYDHYQGQPIIAMTGRRDLEVEAYTALGFAQVLQKPFSKGELIGMLNMLGIKTEKVPEKPAIKKDKEEATSHLYDLEIINSFLGDNDDAVYEVLQTFLRDTEINMQQLTEAVSVIDYAKINQVSHRMLPMFRQLKVDSTVPTLEKLEIANWKIMNRGQLLDALQKVKKGITDLTSELNEYLATSLSYND